MSINIKTSTDLIEIGGKVTKEKIISALGYEPANGEIETTVDNHISDTDIHITSDERELWTENVENLNTHITDTTLHVTSEEKQTWNAKADLTYVDTELDKKSDTGHTHIVSNITDLTASAIELNYMDGVTSNVQEQLNGKADSGHTHDMSSYYTKDEVDSKIPTVPTNVSEFTNDSGYITKDVSDLSNYYIKSETYNKTEVDEFVDELEGNIDTKANSADVYTKSEVDSKIPSYITTGAQSGTTIGSCATAEGDETTASGDYSHAEGYRTTASGIGSHAEGNSTTASGASPHAEGGYTTASGDYSHAEGFNTTASSSYSHAEGLGTTASGYYSHAAGYYTIANNFQYVVGKYNTDTTAPTSSTDTTAAAGLFIVGIGSSDGARSNGFRVSASGKVYGTGVFGTSGADYAEYFEWFDGNPNNEDRRGHFVTLDGGKIRYATSNDDYILGVVSANPSVAGDIHSESWHDMYLKDIYGSKIVEVVEVEETTNENGEIIPAHTERRWVLNPDYNPDVKYVSREERPEWAAIGIVGKLVVVDDGTCQVNGYCYPNVDGIATASQEKTNYRVMERLDDTHIRIFIR